MPQVRTANSKVQETAYRWAHNRALTALRQRHEEDHQAYMTLSRIMEPHLSPRARFNAAQRDLKAEFREEFEGIFRPLYEARLKEVGYAPAPRGGHATGIRARRGTPL